MKPRTATTLLAAGGIVAASFGITPGWAWAANTRPQPPAGFQPTTLSADYCGFEVRLESPRANEYVIRETVTDSGIVDKITGYLGVTATNLSSGKSLSYNISGPGTVTTRLDPATGDYLGFTIDSAGPNLLWTLPENSYQGVPTLSYTTGRIHVEVDANGMTTAYDLAGGSRQTDVCAALS
jgi:hypothetical protein